MPETASAPSSTPEAPEAESAGGLAGLARDYPVMLIGGGLAIGLLAGALIPRKAGNRIARGAAAIAAAAGEVGFALSRHSRQEAGSEPDEAVLEQSPHDVAESPKRRSSIAGLAEGTGAKLAEEALRLVLRRKS